MSQMSGETRNSSNKFVPIRVTVSAAISVDGFLDDDSQRQLRLSNELDFAAVHQLRTEHDAILVGANTIRKDNPRLGCDKSPKPGLPARPIKVTLTNRGDLDPGARFFTSGDAPRFVFCPSTIAPGLTAKLGGLADVVACGDSSVELVQMLEELSRRGVTSLLVEGGESVLTQFFSLNLVHEFRLAIAPVFVGAVSAPRLVSAASFPFDASRRMKLLRSEMIGDMGVLTYSLEQS